MPCRAVTDTPAASRVWLGWAALAYTGFVVYGSLVPFDYRALPWKEAWAQFAAIPFLDLGIGSRADWVANLLLFIPLVFLWLGTLCAGRGAAARFVATAGVLPLAVALSVAIEFTQVFFPQRTVSQNDILAETIGGVLGAAAWWATGSRFLLWLQSWQRVHARSALAERWAWVYLAGVLVYNVLPLNLTISVVEIFHKWREGRINLLPFGSLPGNASDAVYEIATDVLIWVPLALLWRLDGTRSAMRVWGMTLATAALLEGMQLFVYSRVTDVTDLFTAALGAAMGSAAGGRLAAHEATGETARPGSATLRAWLPFALAAVWIAALLAVFWFPFDFRTDGAFIRSRFELAQRVPFEVYYFGTEYRAATEVLRKTLFFAPLGGFLAWGVARQPWRWRTALFAFAMLVLAGLPAVVELGQLMLPEKIADATDWLLAWLGGVVGYAAVRRTLRAPRRQRAPHPAPRTAPAEGHPEGHVAAPARMRWHLPLTVAGMTLLFWGAAKLPVVPYNVRELLRQEDAALSALLLALACVWLAVWPVWLARRRISGVIRLVQVPLGMLTYGTVAFLLLWAAVPQESLHDLVGSPVLGWPGEWETALRWIALAAIPGTLAYLAVQSVRHWRGRRMSVLHFWAALPLLLLGYWGVVAQAATDNLLELIAAPQPVAFAVLCVWLYSVFLAAALLASPGTHGQRWMRLVLLPASLPLAALCLQLGLADTIDKYGQQFSALQFLLSSDRRHYAAMPLVWARYGVLHVLVVATLVFVQWPYLRAAPQLHRQASHDSD